MLPPFPCPSRLSAHSPLALRLSALTVLILCPASAMAGVDPFGELGANDFRISFQQGTGDPDYDAQYAAVAYNPDAEEYLVFWTGKTDCTVGDSETEIYGRRLDARTGALLGQLIVVSEVGPRCDAAYEAISPAVAYNAMRDEFLVVWYGDDDENGLVDDEQEIFGQRLGVPAIFADGFETCIVTTSQGVLDTVAAGGRPGDTTDGPVPASAQGCPARRYGDGTVRISPPPAAPDRPVRAGAGPRRPGSGYVPPVSRRWRSGGP